MKKILSIKYNDWSFNLALLILRVGLAVMLMSHGWQKVEHFADLQDTFLNFMGLGSHTSVVLAIFGELICSGFVLLGLFTRIAAIPIIITMCVAFFIANNATLFGHGQLPALFLLGALVILLLGPGKISLDKLLSK